MTANTDVQADHRELLLQAYAAYHNQDVESLLALVSDDGGRLHGKAEVRTYWTEQWIHTRMHDEPVRFDQRAEGRIAVHISQVVRSLDGSIISQGDVLHIHLIEGMHISRLDIEAHLKP